MSDAGVDAAEMGGVTAGVSPKSRAKYAKTKLLSLGDLDGRTQAARYAREKRAEVVADLGGEDGLSTLERIAVDNVVLLAALVNDVGIRWLRGEDVETESVPTLANSFNRTAAAIGWQRRAKDVTPSIHEYVASKRSRSTTDDTTAVEDEVP